MRLAIFTRLGHGELIRATFGPIWVGFPPSVWASPALARY